MRGSTVVRGDSVYGSMYMQYDVKLWLTEIIATALLCVTSLHDSRNHTSDARITVLTCSG